VPVVVRWIFVMSFLMPLEASGEPLASAVTVGVHQELGPWMTAHTKLTAGASHRFRDRIQVSLAIAVGGRRDAIFGETLVVHEELAGAAVVLHATRSLNVIVGWRVGHTEFRLGEMNVHAVALAPSVVLERRLRGHWRLAVEPLGGKAYWSRAWAFTLLSRVDLEYAF
jgi:hypothetical protein